jgi:5-methylcytosine-specific restriction endonuclease McrA
MLRYHSDPAFRDDYLARAHARRVDRLGPGHEKITIAYLVERDRGRCGICREPVRDKRGTLRGPSIDHIVPLSRGGMHEAANVHLAHLDCNLSKNCYGGGEQLLLFG